MGSAGAENLLQGTRWCAWAATQEAVRVLQGELGIIGRRRPWECQAAGPGRPGTADMLSLQPSCREQGCEGHGAQSCLPTSCHLSLLSPQKGPWAGTWPGSFTGALCEWAWAWCSQDLLSLQVQKGGTWEGRTHTLLLRGLSPSRSQGSQVSAGLHPWWPKTQAHRLRTRCSGDWRG